MPTTELPPPTDAAYEYMVTVQAAWGVIQSFGDFLGDSNLPANIAQITNDLDAPEENVEARQAQDRRIEAWFFRQLEQWARNQAEPREWRLARGEA